MPRPRVTTLATAMGVALAGLLPATAAGAGTTGTQTYACTGLPIPITMLVETALPDTVRPGANVPVSSTVTLTEDLTDPLRNLVGAAAVEGSIVAALTVNNVSTPVTLPLPRTTIPVTGPVVIKTQTTTRLNAGRGSWTLGTFDIKLDLLSADGFTINPDGPLAANCKAPAFAPVPISVTTSGPANSNPTSAPTAAPTSQATAAPAGPATMPTPAQTIPPLSKSGAVTDTFASTRRRVGAGRPVVVRAWVNSASGEAVNGLATVTVTGPSLRKPRRVTAAVTSGRARLAVTKLKRGRYVAQVTYAGQPGITAGSHSDPVQFRVG